MNHPNKDSFPREYVLAKRGLKKVLSRINKTNGRAKALANKLKT